MGLDAEAALQAFAKRQYSVFTRTQVLRVGLSDDWLRERISRDLVQRMHRGVFVPAAVPIGWEQRVMAANLACGPTAVASHLSAGVIWGVLEELVVPHVTVPEDRVRNRPGLVVHRTEMMEVVSRSRFRVTKPMRSLLDLGGILVEERLEVTLDNAVRIGLVRVDRLQSYLAEPRNKAAKGAGTLRGLVSYRTPGRSINREMESRFFGALRRSGLPQPVPQFAVDTPSGRRFIDFAYPDRMLAIELDGFESHGTRDAFERDRARQNELEQVGYSFRRFTWTQVRNHSDHVVATVAAALGYVPVRWRASSANR